MIQAPPTSKEVSAAYLKLSVGLRGILYPVRDLIFETALTTPGCGQIVEDVKWGQPAYLTEKPKSGTTLRLGPSPDDPERGALFVHCSTSLIEDYQARYGDLFDYAGNRALVIPADLKAHREAVAHCIALGLMYHKRS
ncbi:MAG: DUF1801 domain-containing protein [Alphaproteobacteria bacterium]|nr:DUF1801 domain-containing protein [Alphaproteobacteria bacterium]MBO6861545.1 DUF1801 domain-containing protein [Alphaproteobacteria bacterium]